MKRFSFLTVYALITCSVFAQSGKVYDNLTVPSKLLKMERKYAVYLPPDYETSGRSYPVLYLLHGAGDDQTGWVQFGEVLNITDRAIAEGKATPMIIVMPDGNTGRRGYFNDPKGDWNYEDFFFTEFMPTIEKKYRIRGEKRFRAISGLSMGGGGTFVYALHHPELFSSACPLSAATGPLTLDEARRNITRTLPAATDTLVTGYYNLHSVVAMMNNMPDVQKKAVRWFIDIGDDDFLYEGNDLVHIAMRKKEIPHEFRIREGGHTWTYWRGSLPVVLEFVSQGFHQY
ncbi:alpha/beta hydrolase [Hufsiella ginkgonis]|uniref:Esterase family protein n=1 Tax=Hufsiella ginkgonis TaxID=2695274 RepID=A0A7K1XYC4_9SPHI|nr:alpha/beta hydrolase-fold protein [Hufsiella ginkgonis]MXV16004.1 esterase family protein [Hufsiella ginkgonis]